MYSEKRTYTEEEYRLGLLEQSQKGILQAITKLDKRFDDLDKKLDKKFDAIDRKFDGVDKKFEGIRKEMKSDFRWMLTIVAGLFATLGGIIAHGFHWF
jgi:hypothetical protein